MPVVNSARAPNGPIIEVIIHATPYRIAALQAANQPAPQSVLARGLIDTGASCTCVDTAIIQRLGLSPTGTTSMHTPSTGGKPHLSLQFDVSLWLATKGTVRFTVPVIEAHLAIHGLEALIGRDVLDKCLLVYNGPESTFALAWD